MEHTWYMNVLLTGATGFIGRLIHQEFNLAWNITGVSLHGDSSRNIYKCNLSDLGAVKALKGLIIPDVIIHAAGDKDMSRCELNPFTAYNVNVQSTVNLVSVFPQARIIFLSSDYVFSGARGGYAETEVPSPQTIYGRTKVCSEMAGSLIDTEFYTLRLSALYNNEASFIKFLRESLSQGQQVDCFDDAYYSPTYYRHFLEVLKALVEYKQLINRTFHASGPRTSRFLFAKSFANVAGFDVDLVKPVSRTSSSLPFLVSDLSLSSERTLQELNLHLESHESFIIDMEQRSE